MGILNGAAPSGTSLLDTLLDRSDDFVLLIDKQGIIRYVSPAVERLLGWKAAEMIGRPRTEFVLPEKFQDYIKMNGQFPPRTSMELHERWKHADGSIRYMDGSVTNLIDDPEVTAYLKTLRERK